MKKNLLLFLAMFITCAMTAQDSFVDDFESYTIGDYLGNASSQWTTWSGATGGAEDVQITDEAASSGSNAIKLVGTAAGGPQDVVLPFGGKRTDGYFTFKMDFLANQGNGGYMNFQGEEAIGTTWVMNTTFNPDGTITVDDGLAVRVVSNFTPGEWVEFKVEVNLKANVWQIFIDGQCAGSFDNPNNYLASLDLFPIDATHTFFIDDVSYKYEPIAPDLVRDAAITSNVDVTTSSFGLAGSERALDVVVSNNGSDPITSFNIEVDNAGTISTQEFTGLNMMPQETMSILLDETVVLADGANLIRIAITDVNGESGDDLECNNIQNSLFEGYVPAEHKKVLVEEATGTWCQWCPRGDVFMKGLSETYGDGFVGVAVHNGDPMAVAEWDAGIGGLPGFGGYPNASWDRSIVGGFPTFFDMESPFVERLRTAPSAIMEHGASFDPDTRLLSISVTTNYLNDVSDNIALFVGLTEDNVTGTTADYNQSNAYGNNANGAMGGYESLPTSVPASQMVYEHVSRANLTPFAGVTEGFENAAAGAKTTHVFNYTIPTEYNMENMHIISGFLMGGVVDNAQTSTIEEAQANGLSSTIDVTFDAAVQVFPNPISDIANIVLDLETPQNVSIQVIDAMGKTVAQRNYGTVEGKRIFTFDGTNYHSGVYYLRIYNGETFTTKRVVINH